MHKKQVIQKNQKSQRLNSRSALAKNLPDPRPITLGEAELSSGANDNPGLSKRHAMIGAISLVGLAIILILLFISEPESLPELSAPGNKTNNNPMASIQPEPEIRPEIINVAVYLPADGLAQPAAVQLLAELLESQNYQTVIIRDELSLGAGSAVSTLIYQQASQAQAELLAQSIFKPGQYQLIADEQMTGRLAISHWRIEDINWADLKSEADLLLLHDPTTLKVTVLNGGGTPGYAGATARILQAMGFEQVGSANARTATAMPLQILYQPGYLPDAQHIAQTLLGQGYPAASLLEQTDLPDNLRLILGPKS